MVLGLIPLVLFFTTALTSSMVKFAMLKGVCGERIGNWKGHSPRGIHLEDSPCAATTLFSISSFAHDRVPPLGFPSRSAVNWKGLLKKAFLLRRFSLCFSRMVSALRSWISLFRISVLISPRAAFFSSPASCHLLLSVFISSRSCLISHCLLLGPAGGLGVLPSFATKVSCHA